MVGLLISHLLKLMAEVTAASANGEKNLPVTSDTLCRDYLKWSNQYAFLTKFPNLWRVIEIAHTNKPVLCQNRIILEGDI